MSRGLLRRTALRRRAGHERSKPKSLTAISDVRCSTRAPSVDWQAAAGDYDHPEEVRMPDRKNRAGTRQELSPRQRDDLLEALRARFQKNMKRHEGLKWSEVQAKLEADADKLWSLSEMERTGGEPDVVGHDKKTRQFIFFDCSPETPRGRTSLCYDREALDSRKENKPKNNVVDVAAAMGIELLTEEEYRELQELGDFDTKTSSWVKTPADIRKLGGALFCDRRYGHVFVYHNGAQSYYASRAFRGSLKV
jgi:hypothetical protein